MSTNKFNRIRRKSDEFNTIIKLLPASSYLIQKENNKVFSRSNIVTRLHIQNYKLKSIILAIIILVNCIHLIDGNPVRISCGRNLSQRIYTICLSYGGICSFPTRVVTRNHHNHRAKRRVVDECCRKACHDDFIQIYCCDAKQYRVIVDY